MHERILAVDDSDTMRTFYDLLLTAHGYRVETAMDGEQAIGKIDAFRPDLVLLDLIMPNMDGVECCRAIKNDDRWRDIKVVMVTTCSSYSNITEAFAAGCDDYVVKPVDRIELLLKVRELLKFSHLKQLARHGS
jgi:sigma-B regulation protein RsbU (phosphoserine phosphatase)